MCGWGQACMFVSVESVSKFLISSKTQKNIFWGLTHLDRRAKIDQYIQVASPTNLPPSSHTHFWSQPRSPFPRSFPNSVDHCTPETRTRGCLDDRAPRPPWVTCWDGDSRGDAECFPSRLPPAWRRQEGRPCVRSMTATCLPRS